MPIICISDLHWGDKGPRDNFIKRGEERFERFCDYVGDCRLYILGDLFDWWQVNLSASVRAYLKFVVGKNLMDCIYLYGNHDSAMSHFTDLARSMGLQHKLFRHAVRGQLHKTLGGRHFLFAHGHEVDPACRGDNPGIGELSSIVAGILEDHGASERRFIGLLKTFHSMWAGRGNLVPALELLREEREADVIVCGHTHQPGHKGTSYYNCGCWVGDRDTFVRIEDDGTAAVWEWTGRGAVPYDVELE